MTDVAAFIGAYPFRALPVFEPADLVREMDRTGIERAWVGDLPSFLYKDPSPGNAALVRRLAGQDRLLPTPVLHPGLPRWEDDLNRAVEIGAPAVRLYPQSQGLDPVGGAMRVAVAAASAARLPVILTVRFEDVRQRHPLDVGPDLPAAAVRALVRSDREARLLVTAADRSFVEEVHFGLAPDEASRVLWDCSWVWGPPEDHLALLLDTVGAQRFVIGTGLPLRIPDAVLAKVELLPVPAEVKQGLLGANLERWLAAW